MTPQQGICTAHSCTHASDLSQEEAGGGRVCTKEERYKHQKWEQRMNSENNHSLKRNAPSSGRCCALSETPTLLAYRKVLAVSFGSKTARKSQDNQRSRSFCSPAPAKTLDKPAVKPIEVPFLGDV